MIKCFNSQQVIVALALVISLSMIANQIEVSKMIDIMRNVHRS